MVQPVRELLSVLLLAWVANSMARRWRVATAPRRRLIGPVLFAGLVSNWILVAFLIMRRVDPEAAAVGTLGRLWSLCLPAIATAFFAGLLWRRLAVGDVLRRLTAALGDDADDVRLRTALAGALGDPTLDLVRPERAPDGWRDAAEARGQAVTEVLDEGAPVVAIVHDRALAGDQELMDAVASAVRVALRHKRLTARLEDSRKRIARAADVERSRIERDLHDGAQQRLIALRINLTLAQELMGADPAAASAALDELGEDVDLALEEMRSLGQGVYPALLRDRGLADALRSVLAESPLPGRLEATRVDAPLQGGRDGGLLRLPRGDPERAQARPGGERRVGHAVAGPRAELRGARRRSGLRARRGSPRRAACATCATASRRWAAA